MTITTGTNGNRVKVIEAIATEWREVPREGAASVVLQNQGFSDLHWVISTATPTTLEDPSMMLLPRSLPITIRDFATADHKLFVRAWTNSVRAAFWTR
jgi:hypothetical protein